MSALPVTTFLFTTWLRRQFKTSSASFIHTPGEQSVSPQSAGRRTVSHWPTKIWSLVASSVPGLVGHFLPWNLPMETQLMPAMNISSFKRQTPVLKGAGLIPPALCSEPTHTPRPWLSWPVEAGSGCDCVELDSSRLLMGGTPLTHLSDSTFHALLSSSVGNREVHGRVFWI